MRRPLVAPGSGFWLAVVDGEYRVMLGDRDVTGQTAFDVHYCAVNGPLLFPAVGNGGDERG